jgi:DNA polymerase alpha-associated DNA helicase A
MPEASDDAPVTAVAGPTSAGTVKTDAMLNESTTDLPAQAASADKHDVEPVEDDGSEDDDDRSEDKQLANGLDKVVKLGPAERPRLRRPRTLETTLFDRLEKMYGPGIKRMLTVQYRLGVPWQYLDILSDG